MTVGSDGLTRYFEDESMFLREPGSRVDLSFCCCCFFEDDDCLCFDEDEEEEEEE